MKNPFMLKITLSIILITLLSSCNNSTKEKNKSNIDKAYLDSLDMEMRIEKRKEEFNIDISWDTVGVSKSGLLVTKAKFIQEEYSNYKSVQLTYKNVSGKEIKAIKFSWYGVNAFDEPADCGGYRDGFGGGFDDDRLGVNRSETSTWDILSKDGDRIVKAWPTEIVFTDGTKWKSTFKLR